MTNKSSHIFRFFSLVDAMDDPNFVKRLRNAGMGSYVTRNINPVSKNRAKIYWGPDVLTATEVTANKEYVPEEEREYIRECKVHMPTNFSDDIDKVPEFLMKPGHTLNFND